MFAHHITVDYRDAYGIHASNGILFNHESPRRGATFVTRKVTRGVAAIVAGTQDKLYLGNLDAQRDWGYAPEYVEAMWRMLQQDEPGDYVIATGEMHTVREFVELAFDLVGLDWEEYVEIDSALLPSDRSRGAARRCLEGAARARLATHRRRSTTWSALMLAADLRRPVSTAMADRVGRAADGGSLEGRRVMVTGGAGFLGPCRRRGSSGRCGATSSCPAAPTTTCAPSRVSGERSPTAEPDVVIHLAAVVGGIGANRENPGRFFYDNAMHGHPPHGAAAPGGRAEVRADRDRLLVPEAHARAVSGGRPLERLSRGDERALRLAKKMLLVQGQAYREQYGFNVIHSSRSTSTARATTSTRTRRTSSPR